MENPSIRVPVTDRESTINIKDNILKIRMVNDEISFQLFLGLSYDKYVKKYKYYEIIKQLDMSERENIDKVYEYLIKINYQIEGENQDEIKKIKINNKEIILNKTKLKNEACSK